MSYMRGPYYIWRSEDRTHFWAADGYDGWDQTGWAETAADHAGSPTTPATRPSGVGLPEEIVDGFVMLRLAQLIRDGEVAGAVARGLERGGGNLGGTALVELADGIVAALAHLGPRG